VQYSNNMTAAPWTALIISPYCLQLPLCLVCGAVCLGEKPYICTSEGCGKRFTEYSSLYKHHVVHTHKKPYECTDCGKTYRQTSTLAMHRRMAHCDVSSDQAAAVASTFFLTTGDFMLTLFIYSIPRLHNKTFCQQRTNYLILFSIKFLRMCYLNL